MNSKRDIGNLADCLIAQLIIHGNSSTGFDFGGKAFWHAKSDTHYSSASLQKIFDRYLYAPTWWNVVPIPCLHLGNAPSTPLIKAKDLNFSRPKREISCYFLFSVIAIFSKELKQLYLLYSIVLDKNYCISCIMMFFLIIDISSHKY